jgi:hypothetical protein
LKFAQHNGSTSGQPSHGKSLDDQDLLRFRSSSSFGWYDEDTMSDDLGNSGSAVGFQQIDDWREGTEEGWDGGPPGEGSKKEKYFEERSQHMTTTKTFRLAQRGGVPYTVAIRAIRVVGSGVGHAQYEVLLTSGDQSWSCWKRFSDFKLLAEYAKVDYFFACECARYSFQLTCRTAFVPSPDFRPKEFRLRLGRTAADTAMVSMLGRKIFEGKVHVARAVHGTASIRVA